MEMFKEYWERLTEWFSGFIQSRWIKTIFLLSILIGFIVSVVFSSLACVVQPSFKNPNTNIKEVYGHLDWAIPALCFSIFGLICSVIIMLNDPNSSKMINLGKFYRPWKLWYWMPTIFILAILELGVRLFIRFLYGRYIDPNEKTSTKTTENKKWVYKTRKLWYWIPTLGLAIPFEYITIWIIKVQNDKKYYSDLILLLLIILILSLTLGILAFQARTTTIRRYSL